MEAKPFGFWRITFEPAEAAGLIKPDRVPSGTWR
jgi:hypothetical protein